MFISIFSIFMTDFEQVSIYRVDQFTEPNFADCLSNIFHYWVSASYVFWITDNENILKVFWRYVSIKLIWIVPISVSRYLFRASTKDTRTRLTANFEHILQLFLMFLLLNLNK